MRTAFIEELLKQSSINDSLWLLTADLGYSVLEDFAATHPERFVNVGVAEQNLIGVAAGIALSGETVFVYSIANFVTLRCLEQFRNDVCYAGLPVVVVGVGGGFSYGSQGYTHHTLEDLAVMRSLPNVTVVAPGDPHETRLAIRFLCQQKGPAYLRLGRAGEPEVHPRPPTEFEIGKILTLKEGDEVTFLTTGGMLQTAIETAELLAEQGISASVSSVHTLKPMDEDYLRSISQRCRLICTLEEHGTHGGLGDAIAKVISTGSPPRPMFKAFAVDTSKISSYIGSQQTLRERFGLDPVNLCESVIKILSQ